MGADGGGEDQDESDDEAEQAVEAGVVPGDLDLLELDAELLDGSQRRTAVGP